MIKNNHNEENHWEKKSAYFSTACSKKIKTDCLSPNCRYQETDHHYSKNPVCSSCESALSKVVDLWISKIATLNTDSKKSCRRTSKTNILKKKYANPEVLSCFFFRWKTRQRKKVRLKTSQREKKVRLKTRQGKKDSFKNAPEGKTRTETRKWKDSFKNVPLLMQLRSVTVGQAQVLFKTFRSTSFLLFFRRDFC